ncbi:DUF1566 domain-containing protein [Rhabdochromatium marinum]|uniref:Lcl C-terminal domain-containing protein n=1 Tax=Rhabdochromatium marinum TaxID=48729 RepID=UPI001907A821|nr:DUF1566 domain-containing protein [Rhabdochromatium marinum]MBK1647996.1 hypothetical protein [Rhabdochromatium marinum]
MRDLNPGRRRVWSLWGWRAVLMLWLTALLQGPAVVSAQVVYQRPPPDCGREPDSELDEQRWILHDDGTISDQDNELMWKRCAEGLRGERCQEGRLDYLTWEQALDIAQKSTFAGHNNWRIPTYDELNGLIQPGCEFPASNLMAFPNTPSGWFWFDSPEAENTKRAGQISFAFGDDFSANQRNVVHLRLVRDDTPPEPEPEPEEPAPDAPVAEPEPGADPGATPPVEPDAGADGNAQPAEPPPDQAPPAQPDAAPGAENPALLPGPAGPPPPAPAQP